ncbi:MAG: 1-(5-phosphoribosyl)-5-amino-4-imidazole-carboxylate carboxylase, partial [Atopobiaceae bacterium]
MNRTQLETLLGQVRDGAVTPEDAAAQLSLAPLRDLGYATLDTQRELRQGAGEVVYGAGKTARQIAGVVGGLMAAGQE